LIIPGPPPSTARVATLRELFPDAKFIYLHRHPDLVFLSMKKIWKEEILKYFCLQKPNTDNIECHINETRQILIGAYQRDKHLIPNENLVEVSYEKFITKPFAIVEFIYDQFNFSFNEEVRKIVQTKIELQKNYNESK